MYKPDTKSKQYLEGRAIAVTLENGINHMGSNDFEQGFIDYIATNAHRTLQQKIAGLFLKTFYYWAKHDDCDLRNEATIKVAKKIYAATDGDGLPFI